ncbi:MAG: cell wall hydrolase [Acidobacteria bacterium]|nr:cell wall hydrolase [Acidobacteriota bacterium]
MMDRRRGTEKRSSKKNEAAAITAPHVVAPEMAVSTYSAATLPDATKPLPEQEPVILLAMCLFGEARGEGQQTQQGVAQTVINRAKYPHPVFGSRRGVDFAENLRRVILQPRQFSSFHPEDPNYRKLLRPLEYEEPAVWEQCLRCAQEALAETDREDALTANSDHILTIPSNRPLGLIPPNRRSKLGG